MKIRFDKNSLRYFEVGTYKLDYPLTTEQLLSLILKELKKEAEK